MFQVISLPLTVTSGMRGVLVMEPGTRAVPGGIVSVTRTPLMGWVPLLA